MSKITFIYALCEPGTRTVRYIGKSDNPEKRLRKHHLGENVRLTTRLGHWLQRVVRAGQTPNLIILSKVPEHSWQAEERLYIAKARMLGMDLVNLSDGGDGVTMTPEVRQKIGAGHKGHHRRHTPESKRKIGLAMLGDKHPQFGKLGPLSPVFAKKKKNATSDFLGVSWDKSRKRWTVRVCGRPFGRFLLEIDAARARDAAAIKLYGPSVKTNFPLDPNSNPNYTRL